MKRWFGLLLFATTFVVAAGDNDCYFREASGNWLVGNSKIEIRLDARNGAIRGLLNKVAPREFLTDSSAEVFQVRYSTGNLSGVQAGEVWNAVGGPLINSSSQSPASKRFERTASGAIFEIAYDVLKLDRKTLSAKIRYRIELASSSEETRWFLTIENRAQGSFSEVRFPLLAGLKPLDTLIVPNQSGERLDQPFEAIGDEHPLVSLEYPARASMQWFDCFSRDGGLYLGSHDRDLTYTTLNFGRAESVAGTSMWIGKAAFAGAGKTWTSPPIALGIHSGDWHKGADWYRTWLESWVAKPQVSPTVKEMLGGMREMYIRGSNEHTENRYEDIVRFAEDVQKSPSSGPFMVVGWFYNGHDTYFPEYDPIPELGGAAALIASIEKVHSEGMHVSGYLNARLCNHETATYKNFGRKWAVLGKAPGLGVATINVFEVQENWNRTWDKDKRGEGRFAVMCPSARGWQDHIVAQITKAVREYHFDGLFLDQPGSYYAQLCFNHRHGHSTPGSAWGPGYVEIFRRAREETRKADPKSFLWTEGMNDVYGQYLDYTMDKALVWEPMRSHPDVKSFVEMWRYTVPWYVTANYPGSYSFPASKDPVYGEGYFFVNGIRGIDRALSRKAGAGDAVEHSAFIEQIARVWQRSTEFVVDGRFLDNRGLTVDSPDVYAKVYASAKGYAVAVWNTSGSSVSSSISVDSRSAGDASRFTRVESVSGTRVTQRETNGVAVLDFKLAPHAVDLIVLQP